MRHSVRTLCCFLLAGFLFSACSGVAPVVSTVAPGFDSIHIAQSADNGLFALGPKAEQLAVSRDEGVFLVPVAAGPEKMLTDKASAALAWSGDGTLAAAFFAQGRSLVIFYDADGQEVGRSEMDGRITQVRWSSDGTLLAHALRMKKFSFGINLKAFLVRWDRQREMTTDHLYDTTLKPNTVSELGEDFVRLLRFDLAPLGDEIVYTRLYDPPVIEKSLKIFHRHLDTGTERLVYDLPLESGGSLWAHDSELLLLSNGSSSTFLYDPWQKRMIYSWLLPGHSLALSTTADLIYVDGHLYRGGREIARIESGRAVFGQKGDHLLIETEDEFVLYDLPGAESRRVSSPEKIDKLLMLRGFRSINLVTLDEYLAARKSLQ